LPERIPDKGSVRSTFSPDFILGFLAVFCFNTAIFILVPTLPVHLSRLGSREAEIGVLIGVYGVSSLFLRLLVGQALQRYPEKRVMMFGSGLLILSFLVLIFFLPFWPVFFARLLQGAAYACIDTAALAFMVNIAPPAHRVRAIGYFLLAPNFAMVVAPSLGMYLINQHVPPLLFLFCAGLSLCVLFFSWRLRKVRIMGSEVTGSGVLLDRNMIVPAIIGFFHYFGWGAIAAFLPLYAVQCGIQNPGYFFSSMAVMLIAGRVLGGRVFDICSKEKIILTFMFTSAIAMIILSFSGVLSMLILVGVLWGIGSAFLHPATLAYALDYAGSSDGTAVGTFRAFTDLGVAVGPMVMGIIIPFTGYRAMFLCLAFIYLINLGYFRFYVKRKAESRHNYPGKPVHGAAERSGKNDLTPLR
jgi:predicted MFS family arabinose efflux permease